MKKTPRIGLLKGFIFDKTGGVLSSLIPAALILISACGKESGSAGDEEKPKPVIPKPEYTMEDPGEWEGMRDDHLPKLEIDKNSSENNIHIMLWRFRGDNNHYVERIGVMDKNKRDLAGKSFSRGTASYDIRLTVYPLPGAKDDAKVYVKCNLHDLWTRPIW